MQRRSFLLAGALTPGAIALGARAAAAQLAAGDGPFGPLATTPDAQGLLLPDGFTSRVLATAGAPVADTGYTWHVFPDGGAVFPGADGGWIYVSNSEAGQGTSGVGAIAFDDAGAVVDAYAIATGTTRNCAGGPTPWGTWLSGEEVEGGLVWECDPTGAADAVAHPAMGAFIHEAAAVDPDHECVYLTEDAPDGRFYRFTPDRYPDLGAGRLEVAKVGADSVVEWLAVPDPAAVSTPTRRQVADSTPFDGGEGIWFRDGVVWFVTKGDHGVWKLYTDSDRLEQVYRGVDEEIVLGEPDNIVMTASGDLYICEDQAEDQQVVLVTAEGVVAPVLQLTGQAGSELTGVAFDPSGTRLYVSSQRGGPDTAGITYEITGPFDAAATGATTTTAAVSSTTRAIAASTAASASDDEGGGSPAVPIGIGSALVAALGYGAYRMRTRRPSATPPSE